MKLGARILFGSMLLCGALLAPPAGAKHHEGGQGLPILVYHQISRTATQATDAPTIISLEHFEQQMRYLRENGYTTLSMNEVDQFLKGRPFPGKIVAIDFDDGWASSLDAIPVLKQYHFKATFFVIAGFPDGGNKHYMGWDKVKKLSADPEFSVESHTMTHPWEKGNTLIDWIEGKTFGKGPEYAVWEVTESKHLLETILGKPILYLAWPSGIYNDELVKMAYEAGYKGLLTVDDGMNHPHEDVLHIHRTPVDGRCDFETFKHIVTIGHGHDCSPPGGSGTFCDCH